MQAPETVRLRYVGIVNVKNIYRGYDAGLKEPVHLDSTGERYPNEGDFSMEFASRALKKFPDQFEVIGDDGSRREALKAWTPETSPVAMASKNIQIRYPDGTMNEFPPGSIINVHPPGTFVDEPPVEETAKEPESDQHSEGWPGINQQKLNGLSKPKIARQAKAKLGLVLDPDSMSKVEMVDAVLEAVGG